MHKHDRRGGRIGGSGDAVVHGSGGEGHGRHVGSRVRCHTSLQLTYVLSGCNVNRRTQADRTAATRAALVAAARTLFAEHGFAGVGTETIVRAAGVTRGALYHQFADKTELFAAVLEAVEVDLALQLSERLAAAETTDPVEVMRLGAEAWLDACAEPRSSRSSCSTDRLGARLAALAGDRHAPRTRPGRRAADPRDAVGRIPEQPVNALAHVLIGALDEAALYIALADEQAAARSDMSVVIARLISQLADG